MPYNFGKGNPYAFKKGQTASSESKKLGHERKKMKTLIDKSISRAGFTILFETIKRVKQKDGTTKEMNLLEVLRERFANILMDKNTPNRDLLATAKFLFEMLNGTYDPKEELGDSITDDMLTQEQLDEVIEDVNSDPASFKNKIADLIRGS